MTLGTNERIEELLKKYVEKNISESEHAELFFYIRNPNTKDRVIEFFDDYNKSIQSDLSVHEIDWDRIYRQITSSDQNKATVRLSISKYAAVAVIVLLAGAFFYTRYPSNGTVATKGLVYHNDVPPGKKLAILTLSDGKEVALDDKLTRRLNVEENISIEIGTDGNVVYKVRESDVVVNVSKTNKLSTPAGGKFSVILSDGSKVWLNASSSISFPVTFAHHARRVSVTGEAYFEIERDANRPFYVKSGIAEVKVLGTNFNVMSYADEYKSELTLLEGSVAFSKNGKSHLLTPGNQILYAENDPDIKIRAVNIDEVMAWKNDLFVFNDTKIDEIMKELTRWYGVKVKYEGEKPNISFTGVIPRNANISKVLKMLESTGDVVFGIDNNVITCAKLEIK